MIKYMGTSDFCENLASHSALTLRRFAFAGISILLVACGSGDTVIEPPVTNEVCETFSQPSTTVTPIDFLFVIDRSDSMSSDRAALADAIDTFFAALNDLDPVPSYRIGVTSMAEDIYDQNGNLLREGPDGELFTQITDATTDPGPTLRRAVVEELDDNPEETGGMCSLKAVDPNYEHSLPGGANEGFFRFEAEIPARLEIIYLTDEDDTRSEVNPSGAFGYLYFSWDHYASQFDAIVGPEKWRAHAFVHTDDVALDPPPPANDTNACFDTLVEREGLLYQNLASYSGGFIGSICNADNVSLNNGPDFVGALSDIIESSFNPSDFFDLDPNITLNPASVEIRVGDLIIDSSSWSFDPQTNRLSILDNSLRQPEAEIRICYAPTNEV